MINPKITIVTPSFNQGQYLEETIVSVLDQKYPNLEYIIVDGGSTDNSVSIIKKYEKYLTHWVSEKDKGQSDAINKGIRKFTGDLFNWLNSDDFLEKEALSKLANAYHENPGKKVFVFGLSNLIEGEKIPFTKSNHPSQPLLYYCEPVIKQQSTFYHRDAIEKFGTANIHLHYCMDYEWWLKFMFLFGTDAIYTSEELISVFRHHADSKTSTSYAKFLKDVGNMLYSMCIRFDLKDYSGLLKKGFEIDPHYHFNVTLADKDESIVKSMVVFFILKWGRLVYTKQEFLFAKEIVKRIDFKRVDLSEIEKLWLTQLVNETKCLNWNLFRVKRKLQWLTNNLNKNG